MKSNESKLAEAVKEAGQLMARQLPIKVEDALKPRRAIGKNKAPTRVKRK